ncbi:Pol polyprotein [Cricetulus griseus]|uniref:Pol polyprotein n=1 Tax=Cricetulus griseus TaxID=10029 RepID=G3GXW0_CRIGR|nr:Pol polyprotein [Cricetulus griseus]
MSNLLQIDSGIQATFAQVKWKDHCTGLQKGPDPVLIWGRGHVCLFFSQEENEVQWLPECLVRCVEQSKANPDGAVTAGPPPEELEQDFLTL